MLNIFGNGAPEFRAEHDLEYSISFLKLLMLLAIPVVAKLIYTNSFNDFLKGFVQPLNTLNTFKRSGGLNWMGFSLLNIFAILACATWLTLSGVSADNQNPLIINLILIILLYAGILFLILLLNSQFFNDGQIVNLQSIDLSHFVIMLGLIAFVQSIFIWFSSVELSALTQRIAYILIVITISFRVLRSVYLNTKEFGLNPVLIFFYLCAVEIAPILIVAKVISNLN